MNNIKNLEAAKELVKKYNSITIEEIEKKFDKDYFSTIKNITGFGSVKTCSLCQYCFNSVLDGTCKECIYVMVTDVTCSSVVNFKTYHAIKYATNTIELLTAIKNRAKHLQSLIDKAEGMQNE